MRMVGEQLPMFATKIDTDFEAFHKANPGVYDRLRDLAFKWRSHHGQRKVGMKMLFEVLRWESSFQTTGDEHKLNNNYTSRYARMLMLNEPALADLFDIRVLK